jgi:3-phosphoshikimate 1-carboxyvinyltransferase
VQRLVDLLKSIGVDIQWEKSALVVAGRGLRDFSPPSGMLDIEGLGASALLVLALLAGQPFTTRVKLGAEAENAELLLQLLALMGMPAQQETESAYAVGNGEPLAIEHGEVDIDAATKLAVMVAALFCQGTTVLPESIKNRHRLERLLRQRQVEVGRRRADEQYLVSIAGGQILQAQDFDVPGQLDLAYALMLPALVLKKSELTIKHVAVRSGQRSFLDLLRQIGAEITLKDLGENTYDLQLGFSELKSTRVAGQRTEKILAQVPTLAVLATQIPGEVVIRDIEVLRAGTFDKVSHLFESLRSLDVRVGEFPEGIVVKGGRPVQAGDLDCRGDAFLAMAFGVMGLWTEGELMLDGVECLQDVYPDFFKTLHGLKEKRR